MDFFVLTWFCGFSTGTAMGGGVSRGMGRLSPGQVKAGALPQLPANRPHRPPTPAGGPPPGCPNGPCSHRLTTARLGQGCCLGLLQGAWHAPRQWKLP